MTAVVHACPPGGRTPCCGKTVWELPLTDRITADSKYVTCQNASHPPITESPTQCGSPTCDGTNPKTWCLWNEGRCAIRERAEKETPDV